MRKILETASWIAGIAGLVWAVWVYYKPSPTVVAAPTPASAAQDPATMSSDGMPSDLIQRLVPPLKAAMSLRNAERYLGVPVEETTESRVYEKFGLRITLLDISQEKSYSGIEVGPARLNPRQDPVDFSGPWGKLKGRFGDLKIADIQKSVGCHGISDFNFGANAACMNVLEVECGGAQAQSGYFIRAGNLEGCSYAEFSDKPLDDKSIIAGYRAYKNLPIGAPVPGINQLIDQERSSVLKVLDVNNMKINFFTIAFDERREPRAAGGR